MKKWVEYQLKNQARNFDWANRVWKLDNINDKLGDAFERIKQGYLDKTLPSKYENVFLNKDYIARTAASTGQEVTENDFRTWLLEYPKLMANHGHQYLSNFGEDQELVYSTIADFYKLKRETMNIRIQVEEPGQYFVVHMDRHRYKVWSVDDEEVIYDKVKAQHSQDIFITFMTDQKMGQTFNFGFDGIRWRQGDTFTWEHQSIPHCTSNVGYDTSFVMVTTGEPITPRPILPTIDETQYG